MLTAEQAREELRRAGGQAQAEQQLRRILRLRRESGRAARGLLRWDVPPDQRIDISFDDAGRLVDDLPGRRRTKLFKALHPVLADLFERGWTDLAGAPYTVGYTRKPFRAPQDPRVTCGARAAWLGSVAATAGRYEHDAAWFAAWAGHIDGGSPTMGQLLAVAIDAGDDGVLETLIATVRGDHDVARMGRHVPAALLSCGRPEAWEEIERLLLAAQRQEGLRQVILETVDLAHMDAFQRMLRLIAREGLTRFAAAIRAVGVWFGAAFEVRDRNIVDELLAAVDVFLADSAARVEGLRSPDAGRVYLSLWALAYRNAVEATHEAAALLADPSPDRRLAAVRLLREVQVPHAAGALLAALADDDLRVAAVAFDAINQQQWDFKGHALDPLAALLDRVSKETNVPVGLWKPEELSVRPAAIADALVAQLGDGSPARLRPFVERMSPTGRGQYARRLAQRPKEFRDDLLALVGDRSDYVRQTVFREIARAGPPSSEEAVRLERLLQRKSSDLRRSVLQLLLAQDDGAAAASVERLLGGDASQAKGGVELLTSLTEQGRAHPHTARLTELVAADDRVPPGDRAVVEAGAATAVRVEDLVDHAARTAVAQPSPPGRDIAQWTPGMTRALRSLDAWLAEHRDVEVTVATYAGERRELLSNLRWLPAPAPVRWEAQAQRFPLPDVVESWWERTAPQLSDDGVEALLAWPAAAAAQAAFSEAPTRWGPITSRPSWVQNVVGRVIAADVFISLQYAPISASLLAWFALREVRSEWLDALLDVGDAVLSAVPRKAIASLPTVAQLAQRRYDAGVPDAYDWRGYPLAAWIEAAKVVEAAHPGMWSPQQRARLWAQVRFIDEPQGVHVPSAHARDELRHDYAAVFGQRLDVPRRPARRRPPLDLAARAVADGCATEADVAELLVGEQTSEDEKGPGSFARRPLGELTRRHSPEWLAEHPWLIELADRLRDRILDIELQRGDLPTLVSAAALQLRTVRGCEVAIRLLAGLGRQTFVRGYIWRGDGKPEVFSKLIRGAFPAQGETAEDFTAAVARHKIKPNKLIELAVYAPQWAPVVEAALDWEGMTDAVYWLHAHTKDTQWQVDTDVREEWTAEVHQRTPLSAQDLVDGAVDVHWLQRVLQRLGEDRFASLLKAAKYASSSGGHKRAELFAKAVRGEVDKSELLARMTDKRQQDAVRALGLLPLPAADTELRAEVLARYTALQEWKRGSSKFGQQRRASEALAIRVAMDNLARNAGYRDPQRLQWAMEAEAVRDLAGGPVSVTEDDVTITLSIDAAGNPDVAVIRGDRALKNIPAKVSKREAVAALRDRATALRDQARRMRASLEEAAVRGDRFTAEELLELCRHPVLLPMIEQLVFVTDEGILGMPRSGGRVLLDHTGTEQASDGSASRIAHATDLLASGDWSAWQRSCFEQRVRQPFKQVFRELYVPTAAELGGTARSERYAGHQVQPRQATALLGSRGWVVDRDSGALRTFHDEGITVHMAALELWGTPGEVEDLTIDAITFTPVGKWEPLRIGDVPPRLFSEAMRDIDLVVSVAHAGGVDPEASASTVDMRGALVRETAEMLALDNVELTDHHVLISGKLGSYSVHLGSGTVHRRPGNALCLVPIGAQHRGRIFLPFADDDPRTAEVVSKVVLLARDNTIKDPTILEQLRP